jgi:hypothetical protein
MKIASPHPSHLTNEDWVAGGMLWNRLRLDARLEGDPPRWTATDLRAGSRHLVSVLPLNLAPGDWEQRLGAYSDAAAAAHPNLLPYYRHERLAESLVVISGYHVAVEEPSPTPAQLAVDLPFTLRALGGLGLALAELHERGLRPHGAVEPDQIHVSKTAGVVLAGYPHAADFSSTGSKGLRRSSSEPLAPVDDIYGWAALAYLWLTGGVSPPAAALISLPEHSIEHLRQQRGLPATGWSTGWEEALRQALGPAHERPTRLLDLLESCHALTGGDWLTLPVQRQIWPSPREAAAPRTPPSWRRRATRLAERRAALPPEAPPVEAPIFILAQILEERAQVARDREALSSAQAALDAQRQELEQLREQQADRERQLHETADTLDQRQQTLAQAQADLDQKYSSLEQRSLELSAVRTALDERAATLDRAVQDLEARQDQWRAVQTTARELLGINDAPDLAAFVRRLADYQNELHRTRERQQQEQARLEAMAAQPAFAASGSNSPPAASEPSVATPPPSAAASPPASPAAAIAGGTTPSVSPPPSLSAPPAPPGPDDLPTLPKVVLRLGNRHLHVVSSNVVRFGRHASSDILLLAMTGDRSQPSLSINREISRKHFELRLGREGVWVLDGWSDEGRPSQHGLCIDGRRVPEAGAMLESGSLLSVTTRAPSRAVPHWRVSVSRPASNRGDAMPSAVLLRRLDESTDDVLVLVEAIPLRRLGLDEVAGEQDQLIRRRDGLTWSVGDQQTPVVTGATPFAQVTVLSPDDPLALGGTA